VKAVAWEPPALQELIDAVSVSPDPTAFRQAIDAALNDIASGVVVHARVGRLPVRRCVLMKPPYSIVYIESDDEIRVFAFPHHKRRANYWKSRLPKP